jgi:prepilin-type N-terminal cleavage/methylation domain-containing protein
MKKGFTLIELLVVIGVMAVIAAGVIATINPAQKRLQAQDATTQSAVGQIASAMQAAITVANPAVYPAVAALVPDELAVLPAAGNGNAINTSGAGTTVACVWGPMTATRNLTFGAGTVWCWCSDLGTASLRAACP